MRLNNPQGMVGLISADALGYGSAPSILMVGGALFILVAWVSAAAVMGSWTVPALVEGGAYSAGS